MNILQVKFQNDILEVVENGQKWVSVNKICENLGIATNRQINKLKSDPTYEARLIEVPTAGGVQKVFCIPLEKLNGWLFTINPNKVKPEAREKLIAYKNECFKVLYEHFINKSQQKLNIKNPYQLIGKIGYLTKKVEKLKKEKETLIKQNILELIEKGLKYDEIEEKYLLLKSRLEIIKEYHLFSLKEVVKSLEKL
jgi:hypothetical protein